MTDVPPPQQPSVYAVWRWKWWWKWWVWAVIVLLMLTAYVLSPPVTVYLSLRGAKNFRMVESARRAAETPMQRPLYWLVRRSPELCAAYQWETDLIEKWCGCHRFRILWGDGGLYFVHDSNAQE
jgi:hypothetical protein